MSELHFTATKRVLAGAEKNIFKKSLKKFVSSKIVTTFAVPFGNERDF
jgi:hypothetical protein